MGPDDRLTVTVCISLVTRAVKVCLALTALGLWSSVAIAQELVPRAFWPAPQGTNLIVAGYQFSTGDILTDPTLPVVGVESNLNYAQISYQYTSGLFGRTTNLQVNLPYTWGTSKGFVEGEQRRRDLSDFSDMRFLVSVNLLGAPSMSGAEFQQLRANPETIVGVSLLVQPPTGAYAEDKVLNTGTNRWSAKPAIGVIWPIRPDLLFEAQLGAWFFGDNDDFAGFTREQDPIVSTEFHLIKETRNGFWASLDANYYFGGRTTVDGIERGDLQRNSRIGVTLVFPVLGRHAIKSSFSTGLATDAGGDFDTITLSYIHVW